MKRTLFRHFTDALATDNFIIVIEKTRNPGNMQEIQITDANYNYRNKR